MRKVQSITGAQSDVADADAALVKASGLFDVEHYLHQCPEAADHDLGALGHYLTEGWREEFSPHPVFDVARYRARHPDATSQSPLVHFLQTTRGRLGDTPLRGDRSGRRFVAGRTTIVVTTEGAPRATARTIRTVVSNSRGDYEIILVDNASQGPAPYGLLLLADEFAVVRVVRSSTRHSDAAARNLGAAEGTGDTLVFLSNPSAVERRWIAALRAGLDAGAGVVQPRVLASDGTIVTTGLAVDRRGELEDVLRQFPGDDPHAGVAGRRTAVGHHCLGVRANAFGHVGGFDPTLPASVAAADLSLRLRCGGFGASRYEPACTVVTAVRAPRNAGEERVAWDRFTADWQEVLRTERAHRSPVVVLREAGEVPRTSPQSLRWAIKIAPPFSRRRRWGDFHFARSLAAALQRLDQDVVVDSREAWYRDTARHDDIVLVLRGLEPYQPRPEHTNLMWVISHTDAVSGEEWASYDQAFVATPRPPRSVPTAGRPVEPLLQATDAQRFCPGLQEDAYRHEVLFVGNSRWRLRPAVRDAIAADLPLSVYGDSWSDYLPPGVLRGDLIPNEELPRYYRSAGVVLNDHWDDMRRDGLLSNRLFDLAACGATVVTDSVEGMEAVFGDVLSTYEDPSQLGPLVRRLLAEPGANAGQRRELAEHVRVHHSFDVRAHRLLAVAQRLTGTRDRSDAVTDRRFGA